MADDKLMQQYLMEAVGNLTMEDMKKILGEVDRVAWIENSRILKGQPFSFVGRDYLLQPYRDNYKNIIIYKGRQVECSEFSENWLLSKLHEHPYTAGLHVFPRDKQSQRFGKMRLGPAIRDSEVLSKWHDDRNSELQLHKFTNPETGAFNFYVLGGAWATSGNDVGDASRGISLDWIVYDERQDIPDDTETVIGESASHSEFNHTLTLGTPKLPGTQFDQFWESSDKHYWVVKCEKCGHEDIIGMQHIFENVACENEDDDLYYYGCPKCKAPLNKLNGKWVAHNPQRRPDYRGYHISQYMVCWLSADIIKKKERTYSKRRFANEVEGKAYGGDDIPITLSAMRECCKNNFKLGEVTGSLYAGIDWGANSYCWIQQKVGAKSYRLVDIMIAGDQDPREHPRKFARLICKYAKDVKRVVCDAGPDITRFYNLRDELKRLGYKGEVYACYYSAPPAKVRISWNDENKTVTAGRSEMIEDIIDEVNEQNLIIPGSDVNNDYVDTAIDHFTNICSETGKTNSGIDFLVFRDTGPDHFLHAKLYANVAGSTGVAEAFGSSVDRFVTGKNIMMTGEPCKAKSKSLSTPKKSSSAFPKFNRKKRR